MRQLDYTEIPKELLTPEIYNLVSRIHEYKGKQAFYAKARPDILEALSKAAATQGAGASNRMDGIVVAEPRMNALMEKAGAPRNQSEAAVIGYRKLLEQIHAHYEELSPSKNAILRLHEELCRGGNDTFRHGVKYRVAVYGVEALAEALEQADASERIDPLVMTSMFALDFLCMHPFRDGNGRMSRLLTLLLLLRSGFFVGNYISLEMLIEKTGRACEEALKASSQGWHSGENTYLPFVKYYLETILSAYEDFSQRLEPAWDRRRNKSDRIRNLFQNSSAEWSKKGIRERFPDISIAMIELTLARLLAEGGILKAGTGRSTAYIRRH